MTHPNREPVRPCCTGREEEPAVLASASVKECWYCGRSDTLLRIESGGGPYRVPDTLICEDCHLLQIHSLGWDDLPLADAPRPKPEPVTGSTWWQSLSPAERAAAIRRSF